MGRPGFGKYSGQNLRSIVNRVNEIRTLRINSRCIKGSRQGEDDTEGVNAGETNVIASLLILRTGRRLSDPRYGVVQKPHKGLWLNTFTERYAKLLAIPVFAL
jgi:hypothetical protein